MERIVIIFNERSFYLEQKPVVLNVNCDFPIFAYVSLPNSRGVVKKADSPASPYI